LKGDYSLFPIAPDDHKGLKNLLTCVRSGEITGLNVTIPHKQRVIPLLDELAPTAKAIGAVNTISMQDGCLLGDNTDAPGFLADLHRFLNTETRRHGDTKTALVLGAGGSARAVVYALINDGWEVAIASRRPEQAQELIMQLPIINSRLSIIEYPITNLNSLFSNLSLIVNTIPLGMSPNINSSPWPDVLPFPPGVAVYDLVYNPRETKLVKDARLAGLPATTSLGMLIEQAALAFEIWTGCIPSRKLLFDTVVE
jgi:shikimate dehydrogenase